MPNPKIFCTQACGRVEALVRQFNSIKDKQRPTDVDDSQPPKSDMRRLKLIAELIRTDYHIIHALSDKLQTVTAEWYQTIGEIDDETANAAANLTYDNCCAEAGWEDIMSIHCGHLELLLDKAHDAAERHAEALAAKLAEAESSSYSDGSGRNNQNRQGNGQAYSAGHSHAQSGGTSFGSPTGHFKPNGSDEHVFTGDDGNAEHSSGENQTVDKRMDSRFYRDITLPPAEAPESTAAAIQLELPPCPTFDGNITEHNTFRDRFINVVEATGRKMADRDKMAVLLQHLKGKPSRICTGFPVSNDNYWRVLDMLADEYDHQEELEQILLLQLYQLPAPRENRHDLYEFYIDASRILRQLDHMRSNINSRDVLQALQSKLPRHILSSILRAKNASRSWNTVALMTSLQGEVQHARELGRILQPDAMGADEQPQTRPRIECIESTLGTAAFATWNQSTYSVGGASAGGNPTAYYAGRSGNVRDRPAYSASCSDGCAFCDAPSHPSARCTRFATREQRFMRALYRGICPKCCSRTPRPHFAADCTHTEGCVTCRRSGHNQAFCKSYLDRFNTRFHKARPQNNFRKNPARGRSPPPHRSYAASASNVVAIPGDTASDDEFGPNPPLDEAEQRALDAELDSDNESDKAGSSRVGYSVLANQTNGSRHTKLLECTTAHVFDPTTGRSAAVVVFFDSGSDTTFVDKELAKRLQLENKGSDVLKVDTFASKGVKTPVPVMLTTIGVRLLDGVELDAKAGSGIIGDIHSALINAKDVPLLRANKCVSSRAPRDHFC